MKGCVRFLRGMVDCSLNRARADGVGWGGDSDGRGDGEGKE